MKATEQLIKEHDGILIVLRAFEAILLRLKNESKNELNDTLGIIDFLKGFADKCHHGKEEGILFPKLNELGFPKESGPISVMLYEHNLGRNLIKNLTIASQKIIDKDFSGIEMMIKNGNDYIELLRNHIQKENQILFPMADQRLTEKDQQEVFIAFEKMEHEEIGAGVHEKYHEMIKTLQNKFLQ
jgi:hemerythrin-like domain-containing protein